MYQRLFPFMVGGFMLSLAMPTLAAIPATPVMTLYQFNGPLRMPYHRISPQGELGDVAGHLTQGTSVIPCVVVRNGRALTDDSGTPYVGFEIVVDSANPGEGATERFRQAFAAQRELKVDNHHCAADVQHVINVRNLHVLNKAPIFNPPGQGDAEAAAAAATSTLDAWVRRFHNSEHCATANRSLTGRREALSRAWDNFIAEATAQGAELTELARSKHLDYTMRTTLYEGHLGRGCSAYGACERNVVVLSIRNRAVGQCLPRQGCRFPGDFQGASSDPSQYNIWDAYLTQISGLTTCYLRTDLASESHHNRLQAIYTQSVPDAEAILYGTDADLKRVFPDTNLADVVALRHYYHPPAMRPCFPQEDRVEFITGAVAEKDGQFALIANTRVKVDDKVGNGYRFRQFRFDAQEQADHIRILDLYPGFVLDGRKVTLRTSSSGCSPYGVSSSCRFDPIGRYRTFPNWLNAGKPLALNCRIKDRGESCSDPEQIRSVTVGGNCDIDMMPVTRVH